MSRKAPPAAPDLDARRPPGDSIAIDAFLDSIIENMPAMVFVKDAATLSFVRFNRVGQELLGLTREAMVGKTDFDLFPEDQARSFQARDREVLESGKLVDIVEEPIQTPRGLRWLHTKKIPIMGPGAQPRYLLGISEDITDRKNADERRLAETRDLERRVEQRTAELTRVNDDLRKQIAERERAEEALFRSEEELRQAQKMEAIGRLAGGIAHDFNNLLSIILSYSAMLMDALPQDDALRSDAEQIAIAGQRARDLTRQLLAFSRRQMMRPEVLCLAEVVRGIEPMLRRVLGEDIELSISMERCTSLIKADPGQIQQILMNLVVNARDAMPEGGKLWIEASDVMLDEERVRPYVGAGARPGGHVCITVTDTGVGLDEDTRTRIFEPFFTTKPRGKGTGLGLSTVLGIVQQSGGHVTVESTPDEGSTFRVYLPRTTETRTPPAPAREPRPAQATRGSETILLVEDEGQLRVLARDILRGAGYQVFDAPNAAEAIKASQRHSGPIHLLVTDVVMPHIGGRELARRLAGERPRMRVLYMSGYTEDGIVDSGTLDPNVAFLPKPITPDTLLDKVRETLDAP